MATVTGSLGAAVHIYEVVAASAKKVVPAGLRARLKLGGPTQRPFD